MVQNDQAGVLMEILKAFFTRFITDHMIILPVLKCILQQIQDHLIIINEENKSAHEGQYTKISD
jgi:hypothetical protein